MASEEMKVTVIWLPVFAFEGSGLLDEIRILFRAGLVLSYITLLPEVLVVTWVPGFPEISVKLIVKGTIPSGSARVISYFATQLFPSVLIKASAGLPDMVALTFRIASMAVKLTVTVSPVPACAGLALLDAMVTEVRTGLVLSKVTEVAGAVVAVTWVPVFPA